jgi:hypothetical protein
MNSKVFIATTGQGIARAALVDDGEWSVTTLLSDQDVRCLAVDEHNPGVIFAGTQGQGVLRSDDGGHSWRNNGLAGQVVKSLAVSPTEPETIYAGTRPAYLYVSRDGGELWSEIESFRHIRGRWLWLSPAEPPFKAYVQGIGLSPVDSQNIVAGIEFGAVVQSTDGGQSWSGHRKGSIRDCHSLMFHDSNGDWVYEAGGGGVAVSRDGGVTWNHPKEGLDRNYGWACAADPARPEVWYASISPMGSFPKMIPAAHIDGEANAYIFRSTGGAAWEKLSGGLPEPLDYMAYALLTDPAAAGHLYAGLSNGDVWFSADYGDTWQQLPFSLPAIARTLVMM